ncbi:MAG: carboxypeptidase regulatory-like domain-containing protein [Phycisphaerae bacterium]|nr:carboxypeptidase regulatory-like domain-containing protein [Phycisphaerae bacterium]
MNFLSLFNDFSINFIQFSWIMLIQSSLLILILVVLDTLLRKKVRAVVRYGLWMLLLVKLVLPVGLALPYGPAYWLADLLPQPAISTLAENKPQATPVNPEPAVVTAEHQEQADHSIQNNPIPTPTSEKFAKNSPISTEIPVFTAETVQPGSAHTEGYTPQIAPAIPKTNPAIPAKTTPTTPILQAQPPQTIPWQSFATLGWLIAVLLMTTLLIQRILFVKNLIRQATGADENLLAQLSRCAKKMNMNDKGAALSGRITLKISPNTASPSVCGLIRPTILIPDNLTGHLTESQVDAIFMHELAHIKRGDLWVTLIQTLLQIAYFYNPLLWLANAIIRRTREQAVDERVLVAMGKNALDYPETLLNVSKLVWSKPALGLRLIGVVESKSALTGRIKHMLTHPLPKSAKLGVFGLIAIIFAAVTLLPMAKADTTPPGFIIRGTVTDAKTGQPVAGAIVADDKQYNNGKFTTITDSNGNYQYKTWYEEHNIMAKMPGYHTRHEGLYTKILGSEKEKVIDFKLVPTGNSSRDNWSKNLGEGPADIKLLGVVPFGGDYIYDAKGNKLGENPYFFESFSLILGNKVKLHTNLVFEINGIDDLIVSYFKDPGKNNHPFWGTSHRDIYRQGDKDMYSQRMYLTGFDDSIDAVDSVLRYYGEKFNGAEVVFDGPFVVGELKKQQWNGLDFLLQFNADKRSGGGIPGASFTITYDEFPMSQSYADVIVYDTYGNRHIAQSQKTKRVGDAICMDYCLGNLPGRTIMHVSVGEDRYEKVFKGIVVRHAEAQAEVKNMLNEMAIRLGLEGKTKNAIYNYRYKSPEEALKVINIVRGTEAIREIYNVLSTFCIKNKLEELSPDVQTKLFDAINRWSKSKILYTKKTGIKLGLICGQLKSAEQLLDIMEMDAQSPKQIETKLLQENNSIIFWSCNDKLKPEHIDRLKKLVLTSDNYKIVRDCLLTLTRKKNDARAQILWELTADSRPWIWWPTVRNIWPVDFNELSDELKLKFAAVLLSRQSSGTKFSQEHSAEIVKLKPQILKLYGKIFTPEISYKAHFMGENVINAIQKHMSPDEATDVFVRYMRQLSEPKKIQLMADDYRTMQGVFGQTKRMIKIINEWHNVNIGDLGTQGYKEPRELLSVANLLKLSDATIAWQEKTNKETEQTSSVFDKKYATETLKTFFENIETNRFDKMPWIKGIKFIEKVGDHIPIEGHLQEVNTERKRALNLGFDMSVIREVHVRGHEAIALTPVWREGIFLWYYFQKVEETWTLKSLANSQYASDVDQIFKICQQRFNKTEPISLDNKTKAEIKTLMQKFYKAACNNETQAVLSLLHCEDQQDKEFATMLFSAGGMFSGHNGSMPLRVMEINAVDDAHCMVYSLMPLDSQKYYLWPMRGVKDAGTWKLAFDYKAIIENAKRARTMTAEAIGLDALNKKYDTWKNATGDALVKLCKGHKSDAERNIRAIAFAKANNVKLVTENLLEMYQEQVKKFSGDPQEIRNEILKDLEETLSPKPKPVTPTAPSAKVNDSKYVSRFTMKQSAAGMMADAFKEDTFSFEETVGFTYKDLKDGTVHCIDFETERIIQVPKELDMKNKQAVRRWADSEGVDAIITPGLTTINMAVTIATEDQWSKPDPKEISKTNRAKLTSGQTIHGGNPGYNYYLFRTGAGRIGIVGLSYNPGTKNDGISRLMIKYKLLKPKTQVNLRLNLQPGQIFKYQVNYDMTQEEKNKTTPPPHSSEQSHPTETQYRYKVLEGLSDGAYLVQVAIDKVVFKVFINDSPVCDHTFTISPGNFENIDKYHLFEFLYAYMTDHPVTYKLSPDGEITEIANWKEFIAGFKKYLIDHDSDRDLDNNPMIDNVIKNIPRVAMPYLPKKPARINDTWKRQQEPFDINYKLISIDGNIATLELLTKSRHKEMSYETIEHIIKLDTRTGLVVNASSEHVMTITRDDDNSTIIHRTKSKVTRLDENLKTPPTNTDKISILKANANSACIAVHAYYIDNGKMPDLSNGWGALTGKQGKSPYIKNPLINPYTHGSKITTDTSGDWHYNPDNKKYPIKAIIPFSLQKAKKLGLTEDQVITKGTPLPAI